MASTTTPGKGLVSSRSAMDERITVRSARIPVIVRGGEGLSAPQATGQVVCRLLGPLAVLGPIRGRGDAHDLGGLRDKIRTA